MAKIKIDVETLELVCDCAKDISKLPRKKKKQCKKKIEKKLNALIEWYSSKELQKKLLVNMMHFDEKDGLYHVSTETYDKDEESNKHQER